LSAFSDSRLSWPPRDATDRRSIGPTTTTNVAVRRRNNSVRVVDASLTTASPDLATVDALVPGARLKTRHFGK